MFSTTKLGKSRGFSFAPMFALACLATFAGGSLQSKAQTGALDTGRLPRMTGGKEIFASPATTIYTSPQAVAPTAEFVGKALAAEGWQSYVAPFTARADDPKSRIMSLKKGPQGLNVFVTIAPAQNNATSVQYAAVALKTDLPFPKDAAEIEYSPDRPLLICKSAEAVDKLLDFYRKELAASGWSLWSAKVGGKQPEGGGAGELTPKGAYAFYIRDNTQPISLVLQRGDDGRVKIEIKGVSAEILALERQAELNKNKPPQPVAAPAPPEPVKQKTADDDMADDMMKQMQDTIRSVTADALSGAKAPVAPPTPKGNEPALKPMAANDAPVPVPETAEDVEFDGTDGKLEFNSKSSVASVAAFYRSVLKPQGWKEKTSVINRPNMVVLDFSKDGKAISLTIMQMGPNTNVSGTGSALEVASAKPDAPGAAAGPGAQAGNPPPTDDDLVVEESGGLPMPKRHTMAVGDATPFRHELNASVPLELTVVLDFYRRELGKRDWKETSKGPVATSDNAVVTYDATEGPAVLKLGRKDGETTVNLAVKNPEAAKKAGLLPKPGQSKFLFGNILPTEASITFNNKTIKVAGGAGTKAPDGPMLDLAPGKYKYSIKSPGKPVQNDEVDAGPDETWGLMIGPGGVLALRAY